MYSSAVQRCFVTSCKETFCMLLGMISIDLHCTVQKPAEIEQLQSAKKTTTKFWPCPSIRQALTMMYWPKIILTSLQKFISNSTSVCNLNFPRNFSCPFGKCWTECTSLTAKSTSPGYWTGGLSLHAELECSYLQLLTSRGKIIGYLYII